MKEPFKVYFSYALKQAIYGPFVFAGFFVGLLIAVVFGYALLYVFVTATIFLVLYISILIKMLKTGVIDHDGLRALEGITGTKFTIFMSWVGLIPAVFAWLYLLRSLLSQQA
jgi:hypothetical protein